MAAFQVILLASALLMAAESQTHSCDENPFHNGCTIPFNIDIPFRNSFLPACKRHDICYKCTEPLITSSQKVISGYCQAEVHVPRKVMTLVWQQCYVCSAAREVSM
ncbi:uncharacterized protein LOC110452926 isoform X2 [Mizuhopecten yessoensis]|uniref:uncharacterized protein LOC110452926 isoform X2 n=1 Tax=Mizuhopecten yessoensis TaxID=6573 RepID=UPI000B45EC53|nr:uncharacterized protein LOC110452926 isoform X2 [Mizuhopecten yessoensis]